MKGSVKRVGENSYRLVYDLPPGLDGRRRQKRETYNGTKKAAEAELAKHLEAIRKGEYTTEYGLAFGDLLDRYLKSARGKLAPTTYQRFDGMIRVHIRPMLGKMRLDRLTPLHLEDVYTKWLESGRKRSKGGLNAQTVLHHHRVIRRILSLGVKWRIVAYNVADAVEPPKPTRREMIALTEVQLLKLLDAATQPPLQSTKPQCCGLSKETAFHTAITFLAYTGTRRGECLAVKWEDLNLADRRVVIRRSLEHTNAGIAFKGTKSGKPRVLSVHQDCLDVLKKHRIEQNKHRLALGEAYIDHGLIFARPDGMPINPHAFGDAFRALVKRADIPSIRLHDLRHTHVTLLLKSGAPLKVVSERAGHASVGTTGDIYGHVLPGMDRQAADGFGSLLRKANRNGTALVRDKSVTQASGNGKNALEVSA